MSVKSIFFELQFTNIVGRCLWSLSVGSPDYIFNDVFFHDIVVILTSFAGGRPGRPPALRSTFHSYVF